MRHALCAMPYALCAMRSAPPIDEGYLQKRTYVTLSFAGVPVLVHSKGGVIVIRSIRITAVLLSVLVIAGFVAAAPALPARAGAPILTCGDVNAFCDATISDPYNNATCKYITAGDNGLS